MTVLPKDNKVIIDGINVAKRHQKPTRAMQQGGIIDKAMPIDASNVALIDSDGKPTRAGYRVDPDGTKSRIARRSALHDGAGQRSSLVVFQTSGFDVLRESREELRQHGLLRQ